MTNRIVILLLIFLMPLVSYASVPSLFNMSLGSKFQLQPHKKSPEKDRIIKLRVPNHGKTQTFFTEYAVIIEPENYEVLSITASTLFKNYEDCNTSRMSFIKLMKEQFQGIRFNETTKKYEMPQSSQYITLRCFTFINDSPFPMLEYVLSSPEQDKKYNALWEQYFSKSS